MPDSDKTVTRYLLGELSPDEQAALEKRYFSDAQVFDQLLKSENELVDRYARGRLSDVERQKFESSYLTHPQRRERVKFAEALINRIDSADLARNEARDVRTPESMWQRLLAGIGGQRPILTFSLALASVILVVGALWLFIANQRSRRELAQSEAIQAEQEKQAREQQQRTQETKRADEVTAQLPGGPPSQLPGSKTTPTPAGPAAPTFASIVLTVGAVRGGDTGKTQTLVIPPGIANARLQLNLKDNDYARYAVSLQAVGGGEIFSRQNLRPRTPKAGASFFFVVPATKFSNGDYILTLRGVSQDGEIDDLSKSLFRVEKK